MEISCEHADVKAEFEASHEPFVADDRSAAALQSLFDAMAPAYSAMDLVAFGLSRVIRRTALSHLHLQKGDVVADLMCGPGMLWRGMARAIGKTGRIVALDNSKEMSAIARIRAADIAETSVEVREENVLHSSLANHSVDAIYCTFGLKLFDRKGIRQLAAEIDRILKPGGSFVFMDLAIPDSKIVRSIFSTYLGSVFPALISLFTEDAAAFARLFDYVKSAEAPERLAKELEVLGRNAKIKRIMHGCAGMVYG